VSAALRPVYLDNNATTALLPEVLAEMERCLRECYGNPSSMHRPGQAAKARLAQARVQVAELLGAAPSELVFVSSATEANHTAILGALSRDPARRHVVTSTVEHPSTLLLLKHLETRGVEVTRLGVDAEGALDLRALAAAIRPDTALVSLMWANNETGVCFPVALIAALTQARGVLFHCDAVQAVGRLPIDLRRLPIDLLSLSGHKLHAAKGVGALYIRKGLVLPPLLHGHQERNRRGGTENLAAIAGLGVAAAAAMIGLEAENTRIAQLRDRLECGLRADLPGVRVNGAGQPRTPNTSNLQFAALDAEFLLHRLDRAEVCASSGAACTAGGNAPSHVLMAMGRTRAEAGATLRFSLSRLTSAEEIAHVLALVPSIVRNASGIAA
jgi:cysteine desulfurase